MKNFYEILSKSILGGISISIGCIVYLKLGGVIGAILFAFGLLTVVHYGFTLYTGMSGFVRYWKECITLLIVLLGNIIGCLLTALAIKYSVPEMSEKVIEVVNNRLSLGLLPCLYMGIGCGFIMTTAVRFSKYENKYLPLLFGVPVFIMCGFLHSIADAFYIMMLPHNFLMSNYEFILPVYLMVVIGNFIGCNLTRILTFNKNI